MHARSKTYRRPTLRDFLQPDGAPGEGPLRVGVAITDVFTGIYATTAILAAIEVRHRTGVGQV